MAAYDMVLSSILYLINYVYCCENTTNFKGSDWWLREGPIYSTRSNVGPKPDLGGVPNIDLSFSFWFSLAPTRIIQSGNHTAGIISIQNIFI